MHGVVSSTSHKTEASNKMLVRQERDVIMRSWQYVLIALGVLVWVIAVFLMVEGSILGERTTGIATLLGMVGMFIIIITYMHALMLQKSKKSST